jgi:outer membrane protein assembly factor BamB
MSDLNEFLKNTRALFEARKYDNADAGDLAVRMGDIKSRFLKARAAFESMSRDGASALPSLLTAVTDVLGIALRDMQPLIRHRATQASPIAADIEKTAGKMRDKFREVLRQIPNAALSFDTAELIGEIINLLGLFEKLIVRQLALVHRAPVADYFAGLDEQAAFPSYRCSAANRGRITRQPVAAPQLDDVWKTQIGGLIWPSAVVDRNGDLYTGHAVGEFVALRPDGAVKWRIGDKQMMYIDSTGALGRDGFLYMASTDCDERGHQNQGRIWKIDPATGDIIWTFWGKHFEDPENDPHAHLSSFFEGNVSLGWENGKVTVYAGSDDNRLYKLDSDGNLVWDYFTDTYPSGVIWTKPLLSPNGDTVFIGELSGQVHAVDTATGRRKWARRLGGSVVSSLAMGMFGELFVGSFDGRLYALAPEDGTVFWDFQTLGLIYGSPAICENGDVVASSSDGAVYRLSRFGKRVWSYYTDAPMKSSPMIGPDGNIYVGNQNGKLYCLSPEGRRVWSYHTNPDIPENDINSSPSMGPDGTVYFGATTGEVFAIPADYFYKNRTDTALDLNPAHDGKTPDIPPGGATIVFMDRYGTPRFTAPQNLPVCEALHMAFFAVDDNLDITPSEIIAASVNVEITPALPREARVDSFGRFLYIFPETFLEYDTEYTIRATGKYKAEGVEKSFDATVAIKTEPAPEDDSMPLKMTAEAVDGFITDGFIIGQPKEVDALGQAMMDSQKFAFAPLYHDAERGVMAAAICMVVETNQGYEYTPRSVNKTVISGPCHGANIRLTGGLRLISQGANIPVDRFVMGGRLTSEPGMEHGTGFIIAAVKGMPDFEDLIRVMNLNDMHDDVTGYCSFKSQPWDDNAFKKTAGMSVKTSVSAGRVLARFSGLDAFNPADHWAQIVFIDKETGTCLGAGADIKSSGHSLTELSATVPVGAGAGNTVAIVQIDLFPAAAVDL